MSRVEGLIEQVYRERYVGFRNALAPIVGSREAAHDVVQEAFARALRDSRKLRREESLAPWIWRIALRVALRERGWRRDEDPSGAGSRRDQRPRQASHLDGVLGERDRG